MGGRGGSSEVSVKGKAYGTEYTTLHEEKRMVERVKKKWYNKKQQMIV